ncbi:uncharacterized protein LOC123396937 [Hordeum vulgare subsp. vulgare]|uniref:uncharacterized protein LOC123396937 n=1 Tax=Hordeum vulgare subsp. vulgare TaxID=112509 RepID=UPI001D1A4838|nr:uncharacterized protein LOC123396937 [Hordeum vulgare subsp. vulgare]
MALLKRSFTAALLDEVDDDSTYPFKMPGSLARTTAPVAKMMRLWNYKQGSGLGAHGQDIVVPVKAINHGSTAGLGHREKTYKNGAPAPSWPAQDEWHESAAVSRALLLERECCENTLALLRDQQNHYLDPTHWETFSRRHILPRLTGWLQQLRITPPKQIDVKFREVMSWTPVVRTEDMVSILEQEFFGKWESALRHWLLSARPSSGEAAGWCAGWKNLFALELLDDERVLAWLESGVAMVDREAEDLSRLVCHT